MTGYYQNSNGIELHKVTWIVIGKIMKIRKVKVKIGGKTGKKPETF
jgi:hypothetical protein